MSCAVVASTSKNPVETTRASGSSETIDLSQHPVLQLLAEIDTLIMLQSPLVSCIRPEMLPIFRGALWELHHLVGMEGIKQETVRQMRHLLLRSFVQRKPMLHSVMYGPPGVGKTRLGKCLAKLWTASGIIKAAPQLTGFGASAGASNDGTSTVALNKENQSLKEALASISQKIKLSMANLRDLRYEHVHKRPRHNRSRRPSHNRYTPLEPEDWNQIIDMVRTTEQQLREVIKQCPVPPPTPVVSEEELVRNSIVLAGRGDFVARYVGQTVPKTLQFLNSHRGKVVFIDEAYLLVTDERDHFGLEAITTINQYMDQHPDEIVIIFGGYKEELQRTIFQYQKGLERRCRWVFQIEDYTPEQLGKILIQQLAIDGWQIDPTLNLDHWLKERMSSFPAFGGDMESLSFYVGLSQTDELWNNMFGRSSTNNHVVRLPALNEGYQRFLKNRALDDKTRPNDRSQPPTSMYL